MPSPNKGESQSDFISRCMSSDEARGDFPDAKQRAAFCYSQWRKKKNVDAGTEIEVIGDMAGNIQNLEIFGAGTHRAQTGTVTVTEDDLDQIVDAFNSLQGTSIVKPHMKLGHTDAQKWFGQKDGIPSLGWITRVWRSGTKLLADVSDVPDALLDMIKSKRFHNVSAEVFWDAPIEHNGRRFPRVLSAVALLGVEMPAVKDLAGLASALFQAGPMHQFSEADAVAIEATTEESIMPPKKDDGTAPEPIYTQEQHDNLVEAAVAKAVKEAEAKFAEQTEGSKKELEVMTKRAEDAEAEITKVKAEATNQQATTLVDAAIKDGKLLPKQRDFAIAALTATDTKVKFGEKGEEKSMPEIFKDFLEAQGKVIDTSEKGDGSNKQVQFSTAAEEVDYKAKQFMKEKQPADKQDYAAALDAVLAADTELNDRYAAGQA